MESLKRSGTGTLERSRGGSERSCRAQTFRNRVRRAREWITLERGEMRRKMTVVFRYMSRYTFTEV
jgi:hypothetical protein